MGLIYVDSCILIYAIESHPKYGAIARKALAERESSGLAISSLTRLECLVGPLRDGNFELERYYQQSLRRLTLLPLPDEVFTTAARLRATTGLKTPDALHLAAAQFHRCDALWTNDGRLAKASRGLAVDVISAA